MGLAFAQPRDDSWFLGGGDWLILRNKLIKYISPNVWAIARTRSPSDPHSRVRSLQLSRLLQAKVWLGSGPKCTAVAPCSRNRQMD